MDPHPLVITALILVASDLEVAWPVEVYEHVTYKARNITMHPGTYIGVISDIYVV